MSTRLAHSRVALVVLALVVGGAWVAPPVSEPFEQAIGADEGTSLANPPTTIGPDLLPPVTRLEVAPPPSLPPITTGTLPPSPTVPLAAPPTTTVGPATGTTTAALPEPTPPPPAPAPVPQGEVELHQATTQLRLEAGLPALEPDASLHAYARQWALEMAASGTLEHSDIGRLANGWTTVGENIGTGGGVLSIFDALANSPSHLAIMLTDDYSSEGIGVVDDGTGQLWVCHVFAGTGAVVTFPLPTLTVPTLPLP